MKKDLFKTKRNFPLYFKAGFMTASVLGMAALLAFAPTHTLRATGEGSPAECDSPTETVSGNDDLLTYNAPAGQTVTGACIKSGTNMFSNTSHSGLLGNGTVESCYTVSGIGTGTVTVQRTGTPSDSCQGLSHIDVFASSATPTPTPTPEGSPTPTPTPTATATPTPAPTATPTPGSEATATPTPEPAAAAAAAGAVAGASAEAPAPTATPAPQTAGAVLGAAAELPETGPEAIWLMTGLLTLISGTGLTALGLRKK